MYMMAMHARLCEKGEILPVRLDSLVGPATRAKGSARRHGADSLLKSSLFYLRINMERLFELMREKAEFDASEPAWKVILTVSENERLTSIRSAPSRFSFSAISCRSGPFR
jgi:hypothetical protein